MDLGDGLHIPLESECVFGPPRAWASKSGEGRILKSAEQLVFGVIYLVL